jgi:hypothetical protein
MALLSFGRPTLLLPGEVRTGRRVGDLPGRPAKIAVRFQAFESDGIAQFRTADLTFAGRGLDGGWETCQAGRLAKIPARF